MHNPGLPNLRRLFSADDILAPLKLPPYGLWSYINFIFVIIIIIIILTLGSIDPEG